jgi:Ni,Fe-hydrogenase III large subunit
MPREEQDVAVIDIPNALYRRVSKTKDMTFIRFVESSGYPSGDRSRRLNPVSIDKRGVKRLLVQCRTPSTVQWLQVYATSQVRHELTDIDFVINPYDPCVASKMIEGERMLTISCRRSQAQCHRSKKVMGRMIEHIRQEYESIFEDGSARR